MSNIDLTDQSFFLGLRKLAGLRSVAPAVKIKDPNYNNQEVYIIQKNNLINLWGCEMAALRADCIRIQYRLNYTDTLITIKNILQQTTFTVINTPSQPRDPTTKITSTKITGLPILPKDHWSNSAYFNYSVGGTTYAREHDTLEMAYSVLYAQYSDILSSETVMYNFSRSFEFVREGYFEIELDESASAFYKDGLANDGNAGAEANVSISTPENQADYNSYKATTRGPWTPVEYSRIPNGKYLKRKIIIKCVDNKDPIDGTSIPTTAISGIPSTTFVFESSINPTTTETTLIKPNLIIKGTKYTGEIKRYMIDPTASSAYTVSSLDQNITASAGTVCKNLRNRRFEKVTFDGNGDFVKTQTGTIFPVDMRNSNFKNCTFKNITFGSKDYKQLILDGSLFEDCVFENCRFYLSAQNILFYKCKILQKANTNKIINFSGSDGNAFLDVTVNNGSSPFNFDNTLKDNLNNLFVKVYVYHGNYIDSKVSFLDSYHNNISRGTFTGNIFICNYNQRTVGDPIRITSSASQNLFVSNFFKSPGSIKFGKDIDNTVDPKNRYYALIPFQGGSQPTERYLSWGNRTIATYSGTRVSGNLGAVIPNGRAFAWEENPVDPVNSSPWHNILYEAVFGSYKWGMRSFFLFFPWGGHRDDGYGYCGATEYIERKNKFTETVYNNGVYERTDGTTPDYQCPATWKGFREAVRALIEGKMSPTGTGRESIDEPCNVTIYMPAFMGYPDYREQTTTYWNSLGANDAARDTAFTAKLNDYINDLIYMAGSSSNKNKGKLSICFDVGVNCATPTNISLYRTMAASGGRIPRRRYNSTSEQFISGSYRSDVLELADWNVKTALESAGITVFGESRPASRNRAESIGYQGDVSGTYYDSGWKNFASAEYWMWVSDPENPTRTNSVNAGERAVWDKHIKNTDPSIIFRIPLNGIENYFFTTDDDGNQRTLSSDPFGLPSSITHAGLTRGFKNWNGINLVSSPFWYLHCLYALSDNYRLYNKLKYNSSNRSDVKLNEYNHIAVPIDIFAINHTSVWADNSTQSKDKYYVVSNSDPTNPATSGLFYSPEFNNASYISSPSTYTGGFWIKSTGGNWEFWNNNVRRRSFSEFVDFIKRFSDASFPKGTTGKNPGTIYPNDYWSQNILKGLIIDYT